MTAAHHRYRCEPAYTIVRAFGGVRATARILGISAERVSRWNRPPEANGTGGFVDLPFWMPILEYSFANGHHKTVNRKLLYTGRRRRLVGKASKVKGDAFEYQVVHDLKEAGFDAHRVPLSGAVRGYHGDVKVQGKKKIPWVLQCKVSGYRQLTPAGAKIISNFYTVTKMLGDVSIGRVRTQFGVYIVMRREVFLKRLVNEWPVVVNMPDLVTRGEAIRKALHGGHDVLVFRRSGAKKWYALMPETTFGAARPTFR